MEAAGQNRPITLIVDDEPGIRNFVQHVAESVGMQAVGAISGSDALNKLKTLSPTIIVMDMQMPNGDGVQLIQGLAGLGIDAKIVIISGADTRLLEVTAEIARQRGLDIGAVLHKPCASRSCAAPSPISTARPCRSRRRLCATSSTAMRRFCTTSRRSG